MGAGYATDVPVARPDAATRISVPIFRPTCGTPEATSSEESELALSPEVADGVEWVPPDAATFPTVQPTASEAIDTTSRPARSFRVGRARVGRFMVGLLAVGTGLLGRTNLGRPSDASGSQVLIPFTPTTPEACSPAEIWAPAAGRIPDERSLGGPAESAGWSPLQGDVGEKDPSGSAWRWRIVTPRFDADVASSADRWEPTPGIRAETRSIPAAPQATATPVAP